MSIAAIEDHLVATIRARFTRADGKSSLQAVASLPSDWDADMFSRLLLRTPGVYVIWGGGKRLNDHTTDIDGQWIVVAVTAHANSERARRHGDLREIGAYEIIEMIVPLLHHHVLDEDRMQFEDIENLFTGELDKKGAAVYAARFSLRMKIAAPNAGTEPLANFLTFHADIDLAPPDGRPEASDTVTLPPPLQEQP